MSRNKLTSSLLLSLFFNIIIAIIIIIIRIIIVIITISQTAYLIIALHIAALCDGYTFSISELIAIV